MDIFGHTWFHINRKKISFCDSNNVSFQWVKKTSPWEFLKWLFNPRQITLSGGQTSSQKAAMLRQILLLLPWPLLMLLWRQDIMETWYKQSITSYLRQSSISKILEISLSEIFKWILFLRFHWALHACFAGLLCWRSLLNSLRQSSRQPESLSNKMLLIPRKPRNNFSQYP